jgi:hypothetical protein
MTHADARLDPEYGESWDPERRALVGRLLVADARRLLRAAALPGLVELSADWDGPRGLRRRR